MDPTVQTKWTLPLARLLEIAKEAQLPAATDPTPLSAARQFAESLYLCPSESAARALMLEQPLPASKFLFLARWLQTQIERGLARPWKPWPEPVAPFYFVADLVLEYLDGYERHYPGQTR